MSEYDDPISHLAEEKLAWQARAIKAEEEGERLREALRECLTELEWWMAGGRRTSKTGGVVDRARSALTPSPALCDTWPDKIEELP